MNAASKLAPACAVIDELNTLENKISKAKGKWGRSTTYKDKGGKTIDVADVIINARITD